MQVIEFSKVGADERTRTFTGCPTTTSRFRDTNNINALSSQMVPYRATGIRMNPYVCDPVAPH